MSLGLQLLAIVAGVFLILAVLWDAFETVVLPRRVTTSFRLTPTFMRMTWALWKHAALVLPGRSRRDGFLSIFGPLSLIALIVLWAVILIVSFVLVLWGVGSPFTGRGQAIDMVTDFYGSASVFFTIGFSDVTPVSNVARIISVIEGGTGLSFLALIIAYLPVLYQAFAQRETRISMLDEWGGSPASAGEILRRVGEEGDGGSLDKFLSEWEEWSAELLESQLSYPFVAFFRSQHENQSWVQALTTILDLCALVMVGVDNVPARAGRLTFAMARHAVVDLANVFHTPPCPLPEDRLPPARLEQLRALLAAAGMPLRSGPEADARLAELRGMYEPFAYGLADYFVMELPPWLPHPEALDNWQKTAFRPSELQHPS